MENFNIVISARLRDNPVTRSLDELGTSISFISLRRGEFVLAGRIGVRYLTRASFIQGLKDRSIYRDLAEMKRQYAEPVMIVEGEPGRESDRDAADLQNAQIYVSVDNRIPILTTRNEEETAHLLFLMAARFGSNANETVAALSADETNAPAAEAPTEPIDPVRRILLSLPDVTPVLAETLLEHFGSLAALFAANLKQLKTVEGLGPKRAKRIHDFLQVSPVTAKLS
jgi:ERCC4-type nuclease